MPCRKVNFGVEGTVVKSHIECQSRFKRLWHWLLRKPLKPVTVIDKFNLESFSMFPEIPVRPVPADPNAVILRLEKNKEQD